MYNVPVVDNQPSKPAALHLSQVVNRVSRCNYVLRRFVREAQKYHSQIELSQSNDSTFPSYFYNKNTRHAFFSN